MGIEEIGRQVSRLSNNVQELVSVSVESTTEIKNLKGEVSKLREVVVSGNGQIPLTTRVALVEDKQETHLKKHDKLFWLMLGTLLTALCAMGVGLFGKAVGL